jgi:hypothetical protein
MTSGLDLPATTQLARIGKKIEKWEKQQNNYEHLLAQSEQKTKNILKKNKDTSIRIQKYQAMIDKQTHE